jgi:hypothetical protein
MRNSFEHPSFYPEKLELIQKAPLIGKFLSLDHIGEMLDISDTTIKSIFSQIYPHKDTFSLLASSLAAMGVHLDLLNKESPGDELTLTTTSLLIIGYHVREQQLPCFRIFEIFQEDFRNKLQELRLTSPQTRIFSDKSDQLDAWIGNALGVGSRLKYIFTNNNPQSNSSTPINNTELKYGLLYPKEEYLEGEVPELPKSFQEFLSNLNLDDL